VDELTQIVGRRLRSGKEVVFPGSVNGFRVVLSSMRVAETIPIIRRARYMYHELTGYWYGFEFDLILKFLVDVPSQLASTF
jgi:hypothetical protein